MEMPLCLLEVDKRFPLESFYSSIHNKKILLLVVVELFKWIVILVMDRMSTNLCGLGDYSKVFLRIFESVSLFRVESITWGWVVLGSWTIPYKAYSGTPGIERSRSKVTKDG